MVVTLVREGEPIDRALKRFKQKCQRAGIHRDARRASYYLKPSEKRKEAKKQAVRRS
ncbi:30S ribosomal protein S21, partial [candidate division KSB1 bacterium]|nr:30S ribosomal protein S21 [candidate division KSB1 bacterium]